MTDRSLRSFALDYYRKRGAEVRPLGEEQETFEIKPREGAALKVTFADEGPIGEDEAALTATSPQWRAILEDLTSEVVVSYRYLVSAPIASPARALQAAMPEGWVVEKARLLSVENRIALGFSHRVTFDASALAAKREVMHHHLWDVREGKRLESLEPALYDAPTIMIRPNGYPSEAVVKGLLDRSLAIVDADTDQRGQAIEQELAAMLRDVELRANQYYEQQLGQALRRAPAPEERARLTAEIEQSLARKIAQERDRHELVAMTDLVALCHASYDVLTYRTRLVPPGGEAIEVDVRYWPVSKELALPPCAACGEALEDPRVLAGVGLACRSCAATCPGCGATRPGSEAAVRCGGCESEMCSGCATRCTTCEVALCRKHAHIDPQTGKLHCRAHRPAVEPLATQPEPVAPVGTSAPAPVAAAEPAPARMADPLVAFTSALLGAKDETPEQLADSAAAAGVAELFAPVRRVVSGLSGRSMHPRLAECCPACNDHFTVQEMVDCPTCGVPACMRCVSGERGPCPACESLAPTVTGDPRLAFVLATYPELAKHRRGWEVASVGPYVVTCWSHWGAWGMVVYHQGDDGQPPAVVTEFRYGRLAAFRQALGLKRRR